MSEAEKVDPVKCFSKRLEVKVTRLDKPGTIASGGTLQTAKKGDWLVEHEGGRKEVLTLREFAQRFEFREDGQDLDQQSALEALGVTRDELRAALA